MAAGLCIRSLVRKGSEQVGAEWAPATEFGVVRRRALAKGLL